jgi:hypothetical protein
MKPSPQTAIYSRPVALPPDFLLATPADAQPITTTRIDFARSPLPLYKHAYALVLEHVLAPSECGALLALAEQSAPEGWAPALTRTGEARPQWRDSGRILWDEQVLVDRLVARLLTADGGRLARDVATLGLGVGGVGPKALFDAPAARAQKWALTRGNERMRFLRYGPGQFFARHVDQPFVSPAGDGKPEETTVFTVHLYLNGADADEVVGGQTTFYETKRPDPAKPGRVDVEAKTGRVLVFQHRGQCVDCPPHWAKADAGRRVGPHRRAGRQRYQIHDADRADVQGRGVAHTLVVDGFPGIWRLVLLLGYWSLTELGLSFTISPPVLSISAPYERERLGGNGVAASSIHFGQVWGLQQMIQDHGLETWSRPI